MTTWTDVYPPPAGDEAVLDVVARFPTAGAYSIEKALMSEVRIPPLYLNRGQELRIRIEAGRVLYFVDLTAAPRGEDS